MQFHSASESNSAPDESPQDPSVEQVQRYLMYGLTLPERALRSTAALVGGAINESARLLVPQTFRDSTTYSKFVQEMLDVLNRDVAGVNIAGDVTEKHRESVALPSTEKQETEGNQEVDSQEVDSQEVEGYVAQKAVGTFIDLAGSATLHLSPMTVLAIVSDLAYGSQSYLRELAAELKKEGVVDEDSTIYNTADLLEAISSASAQTSATLETPPLSVEGLRKTIDDTQARLEKIDPTKLLPQSELQRLWEDMQDMAAKQDTSLFEISSTLTVYSLNQVSTVTKGALTTVRVTGNLLDQHLFDHYRQGLVQIEQQGVYGVLAESSKPYLEALWFNFSSDRATVTEDVVTGRLIGRAWRWCRTWFKRR